MTQATELGSKELRVEAIYTDETRSVLVGWAVYGTEHDGQWGIVHAESYPYEVRHDHAVHDLRECILELLEHF